MCVNSSWASHPPVSLGPQTRCRSPKALISRQLCLQQQPRRIQNSPSRWWWGRSNIYFCHYYRPLDEARCGAKWIPATSSVPCLQAGALSYAFAFSPTFSAQNNMLSLDFTSANNACGQFLFVAVSRKLVGTEFNSESIFYCCVVP